jgi:hypothetical protein
MVGVPTRWRRGVRSPEFHQIEIVDGIHQWQSNDGDYFPEWLRELAVALVRPVPLPMDVLVQRVKTGGAPLALAGEGERPARLHRSDEYQLGPYWP